MAGLPVIRCFKKEGFLRQKVMHLIGENLKNHIMMSALDNWYELRTVFVVVFIIQIPSYIVMTY